MPETVPPLSAADFSKIADYIKTEFDARLTGRTELKEKWDEIDRQLAMKPKPREISSGQKDDWYPALEEPLQYNALEVILADLHSMIFPNGAEWFSPMGYLSDDYLTRFNRRRETIPLIGRIATDAGVDKPDTSIDQDGADALVKASLDYFHRLYDFRAKMNLAFVEGVKYGTGVTRLKQVKFSRFHHEFRGVKDETVIGPSLAPTSIRNVYPDPSPHFILHEGAMTLPTVISFGVQLLDDLKRAARVGKGWRTGVVSRLEPLKSSPNDKRGHVDKLIAEGDIIVPKSEGSIFLPNVTVTVVVSGKGAQVVRLEKNSMPWRSYVFFDYLKDDVNSPYGGSPLAKASPVQAAATLALNDLLAAGHLNAKPPVAYDRNDSQFAINGGPEIFPGAMWETDAPDRIFPQKIGDLNGLLNSYLALLKKHEDLTGANDPRRGAGVKSHTGTGANLADIERGFARTQNVADDWAAGPVTTILNMEYDVIKASLTKSQPIPVDSQGIEGWVDLHADDLPDRVMFRVHGAAGVAAEREKVSNFFTASQFALQITQFAAQLGQPIDVDFVSMITEGFQNAGIQNVARFVRRGQANPPGPPSAPELQGANGSDPAQAIEALEAFGGQLAQ